MSRISLSNTGEWKLEFDDQDIRGYTVVDRAGTAIGTVDAMIVNTDEERVDAIVLEDGTELAAQDLTIADGIVQWAGGGTEATDVTEGVSVYSDSGQVLRRERVEDGDYDAHREAFRTHHASSYGATGSPFEDLDPAYRYGFDAAHGDANRDRPFLDAEPDLRSGYDPGRDFDADHAAVRYGYTRAQHPTR